MERTPGRVPLVIDCSRTVFHCSRTGTKMIQNCMRRTWTEKYEHNQRQTKQLSKLELKSSKLNSFPIYSHWNFCPTVKIFRLENSDLKIPKMKNIWGDMNLASRNEFKNSFNQFDILFVPRFWINHVVNISNLCLQDLT